jgi:hypothetical protein
VRVILRALALRQLAESHKRCPSPRKPCAKSITVTAVVAWTAPSTTSSDPALSRFWTIPRSSASSPWSAANRQKGGRVGLCA